MSMLLMNPENILTDDFRPMTDCFKLNTVSITSYDTSRAFAIRFGCLQVPMLQLTVNINEK